MAAEPVLTQSQIEVLSQLADFMSGDKNKGQHTKTPANFSTFTPLHGSGGIFAVAGLERDIITAHIRPMGIANALPLLPTVYEDPRFGSLTGVTDDVGSEPTYVCEDAPTGYIKGCNLTARFGTVRRDTNTIDIEDTIMRLHRGDFTDLTLRGRLLGLSGLEPGGMNEGQVLDIVTMSEMVNVAVRTERRLLRLIWQGVITNQWEFPGLDVQIATGQSDADTGVLCPALDSDVKDYNYAALGVNIVTYLSQLEWYLHHNAERMGLMPVEWVVAMRPDLWYELTAVWPCAYNTNRCEPVLGQQAEVFVDGRENVRERDAMREGMYIDINGRRYRVIVDDGIFEHTNVNNANVPAGSYASSIYMVPLTIGGGLPVTFREYLDFRRAAPEVSLLRGMETFFWTDNGVYTWAYEAVKWCYKLALKTVQRVVLRTPQLAGRIDHVMYSPLQHLREPNPDDPYFLDGGVSLRGNTVGTPYAAWSSR